MYAAVAVQLGGVRASVALTGVAALVSSCQPVVALSTPTTAGARTIVLLQLLAGDLVRADVVEVPDDGSSPRFPSFSWNSASGDLRQVVALRYRCPPAVLGLSAGPQALLTKPLETQELPSPVGVEVSVPDDAEHRAFTASDAQWDAALKRLPVQSGHLCERYGSKLETRPLALDRTVVEVHVTGATRFSDGRALYAGYSFSEGMQGPTRAFLISEEGAIDHVPLVSSSTSTPVVAGPVYQDPSGELVIFQGNCPPDEPAKRCEYSKGKVGQALRPGLLTTRGLDESGGQWLSLVGPAEVGGEVLAGRVSSVHPEVFAFQGESGDRIYRGDGIGYPEILRMDRDQLILVGMSLGDTVVRRAVRARTSTTFTILSESLPKPLPERSLQTETPTGVTLDPQLGVVLSTTFMELTAPKGGALLIRGPDGWERLPGSVVPQIYAGWVASIGNGLVLFGGADQDQNRMRLVAYDTVAHRLCGGVEVPRDGDINSRAFWIQALGPTKLVVFSSFHGNAGLLVESSRAAVPDCLTE